MKSLPYGLVNSNPLKNTSLNVTVNEWRTADKELRVRIKSTASTSPKHRGGSLSTELKTELEGIELSASARLRSPGGQLAKYGCCMPLPPPSNSNGREGVMGLVFCHLVYYSHLHAHCLLIYFINYLITLTWLPAPLFCSFPLFN